MGSCPDLILIRNFIEISKNHTLDPYSREVFVGLSKYLRYEVEQIFVSASSEWYFVFISKCFSVSLKC